MLQYLLIYIFVTAASGQYLNLTEGSDCYADNLKGICVDINRCLSDFVLMKNLGIKPVACSKIGNSLVVCCTDCSLVYDARYAVLNPKGGVLWKSGLRAADACLDYLEELPYECKNRDTSFYKHFYDNLNCTELRFTEPVEGGDDARRGEYPHMALLGYGPSEENLQWLCGGTLIHENFILTAGHCISSPTIGEVKYVALGILKRTDPPHLWQKHRVKRIIPHPDYHSPSKYNDIALLETQTKITFSPTSLPACLTVDEYIYDTAQVTGWGTLGYKKELADNLQTVKLELFTHEECSKHYPKNRHLKRGYDRTTQMCYGDHEKSKDTCEGDSGGPIQILGVQCQYTIIGVTSYGRNCGIAGGSGMYTRLYPFVEWIQDIVWPLTN